MDKHFHESYLCRVTFSAMFFRVTALLFILTTSWEVSAFKECSRSKFNSFDKRIVNGEDAKKCEFPWIVSVEETDESFCGGSVIDENTVITAAHCVMNFPKNKPQNLFVTAGEHILSQSEGTEQTVGIERIIIHPKFSRVIFNDIAILKLSTPLNLSSECVSPICLPAKNQSFQGPCVVSGWGDLRFGGHDSDVLQKVEVPLVSDATCRKSYSILREYHLCAGYAEGGKDACQGDSGGPLVCRSPDGKSYLAGVVSTGGPCAFPNYYGVYTEVSFYTDWIADSKDKNFFNY